MLMLPRGLVLRTPLLRQSRVLTLFRYLLKEANRSSDEIVRNSVKNEVKKTFRDNKGLTQYRKYNRAIAAGEALAGYFGALDSPTPHVQRVYFSRRKAYKEIISLAYGKKGPIHDQLAVVPPSALTSEDRFKGEISGKKVRVKGCKGPKQSISRKSGCSMREKGSRR